MNQFDPLTILNRLLRGWWLMVVLAALGALLGRGAAAFLPPVYSAQAEYYVSVDYTLFAEEHDLETVLALDLKDTFDAVSEIALSPDVVEATVNAAAEAGISLTTDEFRQKIGLDRYYTSWMFSVRDADPQTAATLANLWVEAADSALQEAFRNAGSAHRLSLETALLDHCFADNALADANACAGTAFPSIDEFNRYQIDLATRLEAARLASRRIDYTMQLEPIASASAPSSPARHAPTLLLLAGAGIGWLIGLSLATAGFPRQRKTA